jgi:hypothetical protein
MRRSMTGGLKTSNGGPQALQEDLCQQILPTPDSIRVFRTATSRTVHHIAPCSSSSSALAALLPGRRDDAQRAVICEALVRALHVLQTARSAANLRRYRQQQLLHERRQQQGLRERAPVLRASVAHLPSSLQQLELQSDA